MNEPAIREVTDMTPAELGGEIRLLTQQARRMALSYAIQIGYRLKAAHEKVGPHGWAEWLKKETEFSAAAASRFEKLYEGYGTEQGSLFGVENKFPTLKNISVSNALRLLAVPEEERGEVAAELDAEHISARELERALKERDEAREALEGLKAAKDTSLDDARKEAQDLREKLGAEQARVKELESRPVEVAVERDEEAVRKAAEAAKKEAEAAAKKEISGLKEKLAAAEKAKADAEAARSKAEKEAEEKPDAEQYREAARKAEAEAETLRKKLASAESGAGEVAMLARMAQSNFAAAMDKIEAMKAAHPETAERMLTGMERIVEVLAQRIREARG